MMSESSIIERDNVWTLANLHSWDGAEIVVAVTETGVSISVTQEKAVDSYNQDFTCTISLSFDEAAKLGVFLVRANPQTSP